MIFAHLVTDHLVTIRTVHHVFLQIWQAPPSHTRVVLLCYFGFYQQTKRGLVCCIVLSQPPVVFIMVHYLASGQWGFSLQLVSPWLLPPLSIALSRTAIIICSVFWQAVLQALSGTSNMSSESIHFGLLLLWSSFKIKMGRKYSTTWKWQQWLFIKTQYLN